MERKKCVFCEISLAGTRADVPGNRVIYEVSACSLNFCRLCDFFFSPSIQDDRIVAFDDICPAAEVHIQVVRQLYDMQCFS